ncbi:glycosyltransferase family 2 protein [Puteibacter caeruleilacunae]|nr:glycosyltransferase family 2 protein [Puteibacter caeruleilacunae]
MTNKVTCFVPMGEWEDTQRTVESLKAEEACGNVYILANKEQEIPEGTRLLKFTGMNSSESIKLIAECCDEGYALLYTKEQELQLGEYGLERFIQVMDSTASGMVYADYFAMKEGTLIPNPVIDYQDGSLRDDFNFGAVLFFESAIFRQAVENIDAAYEYAGLYALRLSVSRISRLYRIPEFLYTEVELDVRKSGEKMFDYVDPKNRKVQIEMEEACNEHLKKVNGYLIPEFTEVKFNEGSFEYEASVIIPVRNRKKTIGDAIASVLKQITDFKFNLIIVDNHSTDGTTEIIKEYAAKDDRIVHVVPGRNDLGIGGCWNQAVMHPQCGKFAIQLDSDDLYIDEQVITNIVKAFYEQQCAMVVGTYQMVNFNLDEIPPGIIDHKEWTPDNGRNNALRINGLGAPRAFYTPVLRTIKVPNVSYGEDYALGLAISRNYQIGRIYDPLYLCRRWDDNSDASLDVNKMNAHNTYKDRIRTMELWARQQYNQQKEG